MVMAERFDYNHFLLVVDPIISQEWSVDENGNKRYQGNYADDNQAGHWIFYNGDGSIDNEKDY